MRNQGKRLNLETKINLVLLVIGLCLIIWIVTSYDKVRKGYISTADFKVPCTESAEMVTNIVKDETLEPMDKKLMTIISQELGLTDLNLRILSISSFENSIITTFMYNDDKEGYEGIYQISHGGEILFKAIDKINKNEPFTLHEVEFRKEGVPRCTVIYGVINTPIIKSININFNDATMVNIILGDSVNYSYIKEVDTVPIVRVEGLDENLDIFYKWDKIYMKPV